MARASVIPKRAVTKDGHWCQWEAFISTFEGIDPYLGGQSHSVKLSFLEVFATRLRTSVIAPSSHPIRGQTVEDYLWTIGEEIALDDETSIDPRYTNTGQLHPAIDKLQ